MGYIRVNINAVLGQGCSASEARRKIEEVRSAMESLSHQIDPTITAQCNIEPRIRNVTYQLQDIRNRVGQIQSTIEMGANRYYETEMLAHQKAMDIVASQSAMKI